jgi:hypothetical protein
MVEECLELNFLMNYYVMSSYPFFFFFLRYNEWKQIYTDKEGKERGLDEEGVGVEEKKVKRKEGKE